MALVSYSDSDSDSEAPSTPAKSSIPSQPTKSSISSFLPPPSKKRKLIDSVSNPTSGAPRKIIVDLPKLSTEDDEDTSSAKGWMGRGTSAGKSGMLSFLPAPKRTGDEAAKAVKEAAEEEKKKTQQDGTSGGIPRARTLGGGIKKMEYAGMEMEMSLQPTIEDEAEDGISKTGGAEEPKDPKIDLQSAAATRPTGSVPGRTIQPFFRKTATKKTTTANNGTTKVEEKKVSLFSLGSALDTSPKFSTTTMSAGAYKPLLVDQNPAPIVEDMETNEQYDNGELETDIEPYAEARQTDGAETFQTISESVGMDEASMRMFMGRRGRNAEIQIRDFNVDKEYEANAAARAAGELAPAENIVRSIKPGKHQLSSLLNAAQSQKTALEESFAQGKRNKREAGSKYGW